MALTTLHFQRRDQRYAALSDSEVETPPPLRDTTKSPESFVEEEEMEIGVGRLVLIDCIR